MSFIAPGQEAKYGYLFDFLYYENMLGEGDSNGYTKYTISNIKTKKITLKYPKFAAMGFFQETQERVRNSCGKRAISDGATEDLLYTVRNLIF